MSNVSVSWTAAQRYEKCPWLCKAYRDKLVTREENERPFLKGRVVHGAMERWIAERGEGKSIAEHYVDVWPLEEAEATVYWRTPTDRQETFTEGYEVCRVLEADLRRMDFLKLDLHPEGKLSVKLIEGIGMFAQPDVLAIHPTEPVGYLTELKSGKSFDRKQVAWYAAALSLRRHYDGKTPLRFIALALLPAQEPSYRIFDITPEEMNAQIARAVEIGRKWHAGEFEPKPQSSCTRCEARLVCPSYKAMFDNVGRGQVSLGA